jgi:ATP-dependent Clp protease protease subunit
MHELYSQYTGKSVKQVADAMDRDTWMSAKEAKDFGLVDKVFDSRPEGEEPGSGEKGSGGAPD